MGKKTQGPRHRRGIHKRRSNRPSLESTAPKVAATEPIIMPMLVADPAAKATGWRRLVKEHKTSMLSLFSLVVGLVVRPLLPSPPSLLLSAGRTLVRNNAFTTQFEIFNRGGLSAL